MAIGELQTNSGRSVDETLPDVLLSHTLHHLSRLRISKIINGGLVGKQWQQRLPTVTAWVYQRENTASTSMDTTM